MNELKPEDVMRALECWASGKPCQEECSILEHDEGASCLKLTTRSALALLRELTEQNLVLGGVILEKDAEIERLKHSKGVAQVSIIDEIANRMRIKEFRSHDIATGYSWAINDLLKLLLELKKKVMRGETDGQM